MENSKQHVELGVSRKNCDVSDLSKIQVWFREHNPFEGGPELRSLSTGICNDGRVTCDNSKKVGKEIQEELDNVYFHDATIKRSLKVTNIESYQAYCLITSIDWYCSKRKTSKGFSATNSQHFLRLFSKMD